MSIGNILKRRRINSLQERTEAVLRGCRYRRNIYSNEFGTNFEFRRNGISRSSDLIILNIFVL